MIRSLLFVLLALPILLAAPAAAQEPHYVTDKLRITVRSGPSLGNKVVSMAGSGEQLILLGTEKDGWSLVRLPSGKEGWILTRFLTKERPARLRLAELDPANKDLARRLEELHNENNRLSQELSQAQDRLAELSTNYERLTKDAAGVIKLKEELSRLQEEDASRSKQLKELIVENKSLKFSDNLKWFLAGAGVLIIGWFMGLALHRRKKRWNPSLY